MAKFNINDYLDKYVMHCKTEEEAKDFCAYLHSVGRKWSTNRDYLKNTNYAMYKSDTAYNFNNDTFALVEYYAARGYTILEWSDFMNKEFTKADLKTGDVILRRNGAVEIVNRELKMFICKRGWNSFDNMSEDLTDFSGKEFDIIAVRRPEIKKDCQFGAFEYKFGILVYERKEPVEMTLTEVCQALGREIKIVKERT